MQRTSADPCRPVHPTSIYARPYELYDFVDLEAIFFLMSSILPSSYTLSASFSMGFLNSEGKDLM